MDSTASNVSPVRPSILEDRYDQRIRLAKETIFSIYYPPTKRRRVSYDIRWRDYPLNLIINHKDDVNSIWFYIYVEELQSIFYYFDYDNLAYIPDELKWCPRIDIEEVQAGQPNLLAWAANIGASFWANTKYMMRGSMKVGDPRDWFQWLDHELNTTHPIALVDVPQITPDQELMQEGYAEVEYGTYGFQNIVGLKAVQHNAVFANIPQSCDVNFRFTNLVQVAYLGLWVLEVNISRVLTNAGITGNPMSIFGLNAASYDLFYIIYPLAGNTQYKNFPAHNRSEFQQAKQMVAAKIVEENKSRPIATESALAQVLVWYEVNQELRNRLMLLPSGTEKQYVEAGLNPDYGTPNIDESNFKDNEKFMKEFIEAQGLIYYPWMYKSPEFQFIVQDPTNAKRKWDELYESGVFDAMYRGEY